MYLTFLVVILSVVMFSGCATTSKGRGTSDYLRSDAQVNLDSSEDENFDFSDELPLAKGNNYASEVSLSPKQIQKALKKAGFYNGSIDGKIGPQTREAIRKFQKARRLKVDGVVGKSTAVKLSKYLK